METGDSKHFPGKTPYLAAHIKTVSWNIKKFIGFLVLSAAIHLDLLDT